MVESIAGGERRVVARKATFHTKLEKAQANAHALLWKHRLPAMIQISALHVHNPREHLNFFSLPIIAFVVKVQIRSAPQKR